MNNSEIILSVKNLSKSFSGIKAVDNLSFDIKKGSFFAFLGENGAGKTTTINMLVGLMRADGGEITWQTGSKGKDIEMGIVFQKNICDELLTVEENLALHAVLQGNKDYSAIIDLIDLAPIMKKKVKVLSGGQKRKVEIARALLSSPQILFLDEPTTGLDPKTRQEVWSLLERLRAERQMTIFLTTHYMQEADGASVVLIISKGTKVAFGSPTELKSKYSFDRLLIVPLDEKKMIGDLAAMGVEAEKKEEVFCIRIKETLLSIELLERLKENIKKFQVISGNMDDVFLNVVGNEII